jgi:hypothetical protein
MTLASIRPHFNLSDPSTLQLDLSNPKPKDVLAIHEAFVMDMRSNPDLGPLPVTTGWNEITPAIAVNLLRRNRPGANRWLDAPTVYYYAQQMARDDWKETGQPILIDTKNHLVDGQHRLFAIIISGLTIKTFVVTGIKAVENLFVYIDNARTRTAATALQTKGYNGLSAIITSVIKFAEEVRHGIYNPSAGATRLARMSPSQFLDLVEHYPNAQKAAHSTASDWSDAVEYLQNRKDMVAYVGMKIIDAHGEAVADDFFADLTDGKERPADHPVVALRREIDKDARLPAKKMKKQHVAAALIKAFNAWHKDETLGRRWMLAVNEDFPSLVAGEQQAEAAE